MLKLGNESGIRGRLSNLEPMKIHRNLEFDMWQMSEDYLYPIGMGVVINIPKGYVTDLVSLPPVAWLAISPFRLSVVAPMVHNLLYYLKGNLEAPYLHIHTSSIFKVDRPLADKIFLNILVEEGVPVFRRNVAYRSARLLGSSYWNRNSL